MSNKSRSHKKQEPKKQVSNLADIDNINNEYAQEVNEPDSEFKCEQDSSQTDIITCTPKFLPHESASDAADIATDANIANFSPLMSLLVHFNLPEMLPGVLQPEFIAALATKYWGARGVRLSVAFLDTRSSALKKRILLHMNAWNKTANIRFSEGSIGSSEIRIAREPGSGYWSYVGTDIKLIHRDRATMNLDSFTINTPESEYRRVVRHEAGHILGFPHEHMRREIVARIDPVKANAYFAAIAGWSSSMVKAQVLTPIEEGSLISTAHSDPNSIMCYQLPGSIMRDGQAVRGGSDIDQSDFDFVARLYPRLS